jgi:hypothetical protein
MNIDLTNAHPCPECMQCLTDDDKCHYCAERDALAATVERLRKFIQDLLTDMPAKIDERFKYREFQFSDIDIREMEALVTATPAQNLAAVKAEALRDAANLIRQTTPDPGLMILERGKFEGRMDAIWQIEAMADDLERTATDQASGPGEVEA